MGLLIRRASLYMVTLGMWSCTPQFAQEQLLDGVYVWGAEVSAFTPCGSDTDYWVLDSNVPPLSKRYQEVVEEPYQPVFVRLRGRISDEHRTGFAADYDATLYISEILSFELSVPRGCQSP